MTFIIVFLSLISAAPAQQATEKEPNEEMSQANPLTLNREIKGYADPEDDEDWYLLTIPEPGVDILVVEVTGVPAVDLRLEVRAPGEEESEEMNGNGEGGGEAIVRLRQKAGKYHIRVRTRRGANAGTPYTLRAGKSLQTPASPAEVTQALRKALDFLASRQEAEGYFEEEHPGKSGLALMALIGGKCVPKDYSKSIQAGLGYLRSEYSTELLFEDSAAPQGAWSDASNGMYTNAIATLAFIEAFSELKDPGLKPMTEGALRLIIQSQNIETKPEGLDGPVSADSDSYGGWRYAPNSTGSDISVSGWHVLALRAGKNTGFDIPDRAFSAAAQYVKSLYNKDSGSFGYTSPGGDSCARAGMGALSLQLCGFPEEKEVLGARRFMQDHAPTWNVESPGDGYPFYYWYYATRAMLFTGGDDWRVWKDWMCRFLVDHQNEDGSWSGEQNEADVGLIYSTALGAMMLEFCCGYLPAYMPKPPKAPEVTALRVIYEKETAPETAKNIEIIFDASNSMWGQISGEAKITIARKVLAQIINGLPDSLSVGLRVYGHRYGLNDLKACTDTELLIPIGPIAKARLVDTVNQIQLKGKTPLVLSVLEAIKDFEKIANGSIILITDGIESCGGDINSIAPAIEKSGLDIKVNIVGFDIKEKEARAELESIAKSTGGRYLDAKNAGDLLSALEQTLRVEFQVLDDKGHLMAKGMVGGEAIKLKEGTYILRILLAPQPLETKVTIKTGAAVTYTLKRVENKWTLN
ncbi:MAG: prenyltransferase/squalene oxidase repeat-containing protein [Candidatus Aminicenantales bacterium]